MNIQGSGATAPEFLNLWNYARYEVSCRASCFVCEEGTPLPIVPEIVLVINLLEWQC
jgi:hypothetical protein